MRFSPQFLDELRARLPVSEVVGRRVKLRKAGREWKGLSPFNKEKTPSFFVNDQKAMWFDFSSGKNGNIFDFVMHTEGVSFPEAVERLAQQAGVPMPAYSPEAEAREERRKTLHDIVELAAKFFESDAGVAQRRARPRLSRRPRAHFGDAAQIPARLCDGRTIRAQGASRRGENSGRGHDRGRPARRRRRHRRCRMTASATASCFRSATGAAASSPSAAARSRRMSRRNISIRRRRRSSTKARRSTTSPPRARSAQRRQVDERAKFSPRHRGRRLCRRHRHGHGRLRGDRRAARHRAHRRSARPDVADRRRADPVLRRRRCRPPRRLPRARSRAAAAQARQEPEIRRRCPTARTPTISPAPAAARRSRTCSAPRARSRTCCGRARARPGAFDTPERRAALEARLERSHRHHRRRDRAPLLPAGFRGAAAPAVRAGARFRRARRARRQNFDGNRSAQPFGGAPRLGGGKRQPLSPKAAFWPTEPMSRRARISRRARCIAAIAPRSRAARR